MDKEFKNIIKELVKLQKEGNEFPGCTMKFEDEVSVEIALDTSKNFFGDLMVVITCDDEFIGFPNKLVLVEKETYGTPKYVKEFAKSLNVIVNSALESYFEEEGEDESEEELVM